MIKLFIQYVFLFCSILVYSQNKYEVKIIPQKIKSKYIKYQPFVKASNSPYYLDDVVPQTSSKVDYTDIIQNAINKNEVVVFPNYVIYINKDGLKIPSNRILFFQKKSKIIFKGPADSRKSDIIKLYGCTNVKIFNPVIVGSKFSTRKQEGEWSAGVALLNATNIEIYNLNISETYGDGIIVADQSKNIIIKGGVISEARRDGLSITSGKNVSISNLVIANTNGTLPESGIQIEPDFPSDTLSDIRINNIIGYNNRSGTLSINLGPLNQDVKKYNHKVSIFTDNVTDYYGYHAIGIVKNADNKPFTPNGKVVLRNIRSISSSNFIWQDNGKTNIDIETINLIDKNGKEYKIQN